MVNTELLTVAQGRIEFPSEEAAQKQVSQTPAPTAEQLSLWDTYFQSSGRSADLYDRGFLKGLPELPGYEAAHGKPVDYTKEPKPSSAKTPKVFYVGSPETDDANASHGGQGRAFRRRLQGGVPTMIAGIRLTPVSREVPSAGYKR